jgi:hypothetical protein
MKTKLLLLSLLLTTLGGLQAQDKNKNIQFNISYFGILGTHPGVKLGLQYPLANLQQAQKMDQLNQVIGAASLIFYYHRRNQIGAGFNLELGFRSRKQDGLNKEFFIGAGYLRTFFPNTVYDFDAQAGMLEKKSHGRSHFLKTAALGLGGNVDGDLNANFWTIKPTLLHLRPFNRKGGFNFALDAGLHIH